MAARVLLSLCVTLACMVSTAQAQDSEELFQIQVARTDNAVRVTVDYDHPTWGWVEAGFVEFYNDGTITMKVRGEDIQTVTDLAATLGELSRSVAGDSAIGRQLAMNIERSVDR